MVCFSFPFRYGASDIPPKIVGDGWPGFGMATVQFFLKLYYFSEKNLKKVNTELLPKLGLVSTAPDTRRF